MNRASHEPREAPDLETVGSSLRVHATRQQNGTVVSVDGELDLSTAATFEEQVIASMDAPIERLTLDLAALEFIDSSGIAVFDSLRREAEVRGVELELVRMPGQTRRVLEVTGMLGLFSLRDAGEPPAEPDYRV